MRAFPDRPAGPRGLPGLLLAGALLTLPVACAPDAGSEAAVDAAEAQPAAAAAPRFEIPTFPDGPWYKGNTHTHTTESDGDTPPAEVTRWYRDHGYAFLVLSDHNTLTDPATLDELTDSSFILIPGEELTSRFEDASVHVNGLNLPRVVEPRQAASRVATIQANVDAVREVEGVPHINHPDFGGSFSTEERRQVERYRLLEIFHGRPTVHNEGGGGTPGLEAVWDALLTGGKRIWGIAVDDAHHFQGEFGPELSNPGRGRVAVRAAAFEPVAKIVNSRGDVAWTQPVFVVGG